MKKLLLLMTVISVYSYGFSLTNFNLKFKDQTYNTWGNDYGFDDPTLGATRRLTAEKVFEYIEQTLDLGSMTMDVEFTVSLSNGSAGEPAGFASVSYASPSNGVKMTKAQKIVSLGYDPDAGTAADIEITIDFAFPIHSDHTTTDPSKIDLFTLILHEASHSLGFVSALLDQKNPSNPNQWLYTQNGPYTVWDTKLKIFDHLSLVYRDVTVPNGSGRKLNPLYDISTNDQNATQYYSTSMNAYFDIETKDPMDKGSAFNHFETSKTYPFAYLMQKTGSTNIILRQWNEVELVALCEMGYDMQGNATTYPFNCIAPPVGVEDNFTYAGTGGWQAFDVLANDKKVGSNWLKIDNNIQVYNNQNIGQVRVRNGKLEYLVDNDFCGTARVLYTPIDGITGREGIPAFVLITVECQTCPDNPCSFICNGGFEYGMPLIFYDQLPHDHDISDFQPPEPSASDFWWSAYSTPNIVLDETVKEFHLMGTVDNPANYNSDPDNHRFGKCLSSDGHDLGEMLVTKTMPLPANNYALNFMVNMTTNSSPTRDVLVYYSNNYYQFSNMADLTSKVSSSLVHLVGSETVTANGQWQSKTINVTGITGSVYLYIFPEAASSGVGYATFFDDIELIETGPQLVVTVTPNNALPELEETVTFTIDIENTGTTGATDVLVENILPEGFKFVSSTFNNYMGNDERHMFSSIGVGQTKTITVTAEVLPTAKLCEAVVNTFEIISAVPSYGCFKNNYETVVVPYDPCVCSSVPNPSCPCLMTDEEDVFAFSKTYSDPTMELIPKSTKQVGSYNYTLNELENGPGILIVKTDLTGDFVESWQYVHNAATPWHMSPKDMVFIDGDGIYIIGNYHNTSSLVANQEAINYQAAFMIKLNPDGTVAWHKRYNSSLFNATFTAMQPVYDALGNLESWLVIGTGYSYYKPHITKLDPVGVIGASISLDFQYSSQAIARIMSVDISEKINISGTDYYPILFRNNSTATIPGINPGFLFTGVDKNLNLLNSGSMVFWNKNVDGHFDANKIITLTGTDKITIVGNHIVIPTSSLEGFIFSADLNANKDFAYHTLPANDVKRIDNTYVMAGNEGVFFIDGQMVVENELFDPLYGFPGVPRSGDFIQPHPNGGATITIGSDWSKAMELRKLNADFNSSCAANQNTYMMESLSVDQTTVGYLIQDIFSSWTTTGENLTHTMAGLNEACCEAQKCNIDFSIDFDATCGQNEITIQGVNTNFAVNGVSYQWTVNSVVSTDVSETPTFSVAGPGLYEICLSMTFVHKSEACSRTKCFSVYVGYEETSDTIEICKPCTTFIPEQRIDMDYFIIDNVVYVDPGVIEQPYIYYYDSRLVNLIGGIELTGWNQFCLYPGVYDIEYFDENGCLMKTHHLTIVQGTSIVHNNVDYKICPLEGPPCVEIFANNMSGFCQPNNGLIHGTSLSASYADASSHVICELGPYTMTTTLDNGCLCTISGDIIEDCQSPWPVQQNNKQGYGEPGVDGKQVLLQVTPNPAMNQFEVSLTQNNSGATEKMFETTICNAIGQTVYHKGSHKGGTPLVVNSSGWSAGVYYVKVQSGRYTEFKAIRIESND